MARALVGEVDGGVGVAMRAHAAPLYLKHVAHRTHGEVLFPRFCLRFVGDSLHQALILLLHDRRLFFEVSSAAFADASSLIFARRVMVAAGFTA